MTKEEALHSFYSSFGLEAFEEHSVPTGEDAPAFPYITYSVAYGDFGTETALYADIWYRDTTWVGVIAMTDKIKEKIGRGGLFLSCENGAIWIRRGSPFSVSMGDEEDGLIRRNHLNITAEFIL